VRGGAVESLHLGHVVVTGLDGAVLAAVGDPQAQVYPRSCLKPLQLAAMLEAGLWPEDGTGRSRTTGTTGSDQDLAPLALGAASHNGEPVHLEGVRAVLAAAGLGEADLANTPDLPLHAPSAAAWRAGGHGPSSLAQNCSGKHAAMLATCVARGWPIEGYLLPEHPLQVAVMAGVTEMAGVAAVVSTDGCGTPLPLLPLAALAGAYGRVAAESAAAPPAGAAARVGTAMRAHPYLVGGEGREATGFMAGVPGLVAKDGAEGVFALGLPDGRGAALKVLDGATRPFPVLVAAVLAALGVDAAVVREQASVPVLGHGRPVGAMTTVPGLLPSTIAG